MTKVSAAILFALLVASCATEHGRGYLQSIAFVGISNDLHHSRAIGSFEAEDCDRFFLGMIVIENGSSAANALRKLLKGEYRRNPVAADAKHVRYFTDVEIYTSPPESATESGTCFVAKGVGHL